ncbi:unnamed protein product, partial [Prorocentrum cordatum]
ARRARAAASRRAAWAPRRPERGPGLRGCAWVATPGCGTSLSTARSATACTGAGVDVLAARQVVDVALMYSEDAVAHAAANRLLRICGTLAAAPRRFVLLAPVATLPSCRRATDTVGVAAGLCPRLALALLGDELGWGRAPPAVAEMSSAAEALDAMLWSREAQAVLWEDSPALRSLAEGTCDVLTEVSCPWPTHLLVASAEACRRKMGCVREVVGHTSLLCEEFKANVQNGAVDRLSQGHGLSQQDALDRGAGASPCRRRVELLWRGGRVHGPAAAGAAGEARPSARGEPRAARAEPVGARCLPVGRPSARRRLRGGGVWGRPAGAAAPSGPGRRLLRRPLRASGARIRA